MGHGINQGSIKGTEANEAGSGNKELMYLCVKSGLKNLGERCRCGSRLTGRCVVMIARWLLVKKSEKCNF